MAIGTFIKMHLNVWKWRNMYVPSWDLWDLPWHGVDEEAGVPLAAAGETQWPGPPRGDTIPCLKEKYLGIEKKDYKYHIIKEKRPCSQELRKWANLLVCYPNWLHYSEKRNWRHFPLKNNARFWWRTVLLQHSTS